MKASIFGRGRYDSVIDILGTDAEDTVPINLHVHKLSYTICDRKQGWWHNATDVQAPWECVEKGTTWRVLHDVSFTAKSGKLMAVMGGSGSGKTSLLDVLACRTFAGTITGEVYLNSVIRTKEAFERCSGYVRQDDRLIGYLTIRETFMFVAQLKLPRTFTTDMIKNRVDQVISELGLKQAADTKVGNASLRGVSGGERRRVSIGIQLLLLPSILILDEPTSGLDSFTAKHIARTLSLLANRKRTIIMSIHQPRFDIFNIVDNLMILSRGRIVYNGPGKKMVSYFTALGYPCPKHTNPCDFYIDLATVDNTCKAREESSLKIVDALHDSFQISSLVQISACSDNEDSANSGSLKTSMSSISDSGQTWVSNLEEIMDAGHRRKDRPKVPFQFYILWRRFIRITIDDLSTLVAHLIQALLMSLLLGTVYVGLKYDQKSVRDWFGVMFMISVTYPYLVILGLIGTCHDERKYLYFELQDRLYSPVALYFAKIFSDLPFHLIYVLIYCIPVYGMAGLKVDPYTCCLFFIFVSVSVFTSRCLAMMSATIMPTYLTSCLFAQVLFSLFIMSAGFLINMDSMLEETKWISEASYLRWGFQALCIIGIKDLKFDCDNTTLSQCSARTGEEALNKFALGGVELWKCGIGLGITMLVFLLIMFLGLRFIPQKPVNE